MKLGQISSDWKKKFEFRNKDVTSKAMKYGFKSISKYYETSVNNMIYISHLGFEFEGVLYFYISKNSKFQYN